MTAHSYVATKPCGCVRLIVVDDEVSSYRAAPLSAAVRDGLVIERVLTADAQKRQWTCAPCEKASHVKQLEIEDPDKPIEKMNRRRKDGAA